MTIPFGVGELDRRINGGAPRGSVVIIAGEAGAGSREFIYTSAVMNGLGVADPELFDLYYGNLEEEAELPGSVHYVSFTDAPGQIRNDMGEAINQEAVDAADEAIEFHQLSAEYFRLSSVPRDWYGTRSATIADLGERQERGGLLDALGQRLAASAPDNLVLIDSLTDLISGHGEFSWDEVPVLLRGIARAAYDWDGLVLVHVNVDTLSEREFGRLVDAADGTMTCQWERAGSTLTRTMMVQQFRGVLSRLEEDDIVQFETEIAGTGFDITDVQKIR